MLYLSAIGIEQPLDFQVPFLCIKLYDCFVMCKGVVGYHFRFFGLMDYDRGAQRAAVHI